MRASWTICRIPGRCEVCGRWKRKGKDRLYLWTPLGDEADVYERAWVHYPCWRRLLAGYRPLGLKRKEDA